MTQELWTEVDHYITDLLVPTDPVLDEVLQASDAAGLPPHMEVLLVYVHTLPEHLISAKECFHT